jgi:hypothetical protein
MAGVTRIPRSRGGLSGVLLVLLGAWGGLAPFVGPYFGFAFTPDKAWQYTSGRLYLSIVPGAAALLGGLLILATRSRALGTIGGLLAVIGGAWFVAGQGIVTSLLDRPSISAGSPVTRSGSALTVTPAAYEYLEILAFFVGLGILIVFIGAIAIGRFSMVAVRDQVAAADDGGDYDNYLDATGEQPAVAPDQYPATTTGQYPIGQRPFPGEEPTQTQERFPSSAAEFPSGTGPFPAATGRFPSPSGQFPQSSSPFGASGSGE